MILSKFEKPISRLLPWLGSTGSAFGGFALLCCFGWTGLASFLPLVGLGFLVRFTVALKFIWISLAITAIALTLSFLRHRRPWPLAAAVVGAGLLTWPMYHGLEVSLWLGLLYSGLGVLFFATGLDVWLSIRQARSCPIPNQRSDNIQIGSLAPLKEDPA